MAIAFAEWPHALSYVMIRSIGSLNINVERAMSGDGTIVGGQDFRDRIDAKFSTLRPAEQTVAAHLRGITGQRFDLTITNLAKTVGVSEATVSRVSRALGFSGFADLKLSMAADQGRSEQHNIPSSLQWTDPPGDIARKLLPVFAGSLAETQQVLEDASLDAAVTAIADAKRVVFVGVGGAAAICAEAAHVFLKIGIEAASFSDGYTQTIVASTLSPGCLLIAVSHTGTTPTVVSAVALARQCGAGTIAITGNPSSALALASETVFATSLNAKKPIPLHGDFLEGRMSQLYLIDVLYLGVLFRLNGRARNSLAQTTRALEQHYGTLGSVEEAPVSPRKRRRSDRE